MYPCDGMLPLARHYHDLAKLNHLAVVLYPCCGLPPLARHHHDLPKLNDLAVVLYPCHGRLPLARHYHDVAKLNEHGTVEMFLCKYYLIGCPSHLINIKTAWDKQCRADSLKTKLNLNDPAIMILIRQIPENSMRSINIHEMT